MKTVDNATELVGVIKFLISQYSEYQRNISEDVKLTFRIEHNDITKEYLVVFSWLAKLILVHTDPETGYQEFSEEHGEEKMYFHETDSFLKLEQMVSDCLRPVAETKLYSETV